MVYIRVKDVELLINNSVGNVRVLKQVRRAMQRGEVISEKEHTYVQKLLTAHLGPNTQTDPPKTVQIPTHQEFVRAIKPDQKLGRIGRIAKIRGRIRSPKSDSPKSTRHFSRKKIIIFGLVVILVAAMAYSSTIFVQIPNAPPSDVALPDGVMLKADQEAYLSGDIILISGRATPGTQTALSIQGGAGALWQESVVANNAGIYSTIVIAGGAGWIEGTTHSITATDAGRTHSVEFLFGTK